MSTVVSDKIRIHGHRGCRGLSPENTIDAFIRACELGVDALEMDVVLTGDGEVLVSHDPFMHHEICAYPDGKPIPAGEDSLLNIWKMNLDEAQRFRVGCFPHPRFPKQIQLPQFKPSLRQVVDSVTSYCNDHGKEIPVWNIEIKSHPGWDHLYHPEPELYAVRCNEVFDELGILNHCVIQSFDGRILETLHAINPSIQLVYLSDDASKAVNEKLGELTFKPFGFSPEYHLIDHATISHCRENGVLLIAWTVNDMDAMRKLLDMGVQDIITDFPDHAMQVRNEYLRLIDKK